MKTIKNTSLQGLSITLMGEGEVRSVYLMPKQKIEVEGKWGGKVLNNLVSRRMVRVFESAEPTPMPANPAPKPKQVIKKTPTKVIKGN